MSDSSDDDEIMAGEAQVLEADPVSDNEGDVQDAMMVEADDDGDEDDDDDDEEEVMAAVVIEDGDEDEDNEDGGAGEAEAVVAYADTTAPQARAEEEPEEVAVAEDLEAEAVAVAVPEEHPAAKVKPKPASTHSDKKQARKRSPSKPKAGASESTPSADKPKQPAKKKRQRNKQEGGLFARIPARRINTAESARHVLNRSVPRLPIKINDTFTVRNFGQLHLEPNVKTPKFSSTTALYPVGFCVDRYEFCPAHGRILKLRCSILDGAHIKQQQVAMGVPPSNELPDGPIFRIMWGQGIDDDTDTVDYPYNPDSNSAPIIDGANEKDAIIAMPAAMDKDLSSGLPVAGMRVKVRFDQDEYYYGTLVKVTEVSEKNKKKTKRPSAKISIQYDDGSSEEAIFPDPDIVLAMPGKSELRSSIDRAFGTSTVPYTYLSQSLIYRNW
jgi:hypothetical protein